MKPETAEKLLALLQAIDTNHSPDWVDLVCTARDALPASTADELRALAPGQPLEKEPVKPAGKGIAVSRQRDGRNQNT